MYKIIVIILLLTSCSSIKIEKQKNPLNFKKIATLPSEINESSGLITINGQLITHNDSGDRPTLFEIDTTGVVTRKVTYNYLYNQDWESISSSNNAIHIADIGNNLGNRKNLKIYNVIKSALWQEDIDIDVSNINYKNQTSFNPRSRKHSYDAEAIIIIDEKMFLFSKDWVNFTSSIYSFPIYENASLTPIQTIDTNGLITDATYNGKNTVLLCGYNSNLQPFIVVLEYKDGSFKLNKRIELPVEGAQIEAITYYATDNNGNETYYLTSEAVNIKLGDDEAKTDGELYKLTWKPLKN